MNEVENGASSRSVDKTDKLNLSTIPYVEGKIRWPPYHWIQVDVEDALNDFWEATYDEYDLERHKRFIRMMQLRSKGRRNSEIAEKEETNNVGKYLSGEKMSFITHVRLEHDRLGKPRQGYQWLPLRLKPRGTPDTEWIQVPTMIRGYEDIVSVIEQCEPTEDSFVTMEQFGYRSRSELVADRVNLYGFFAGNMIGDTGKTTKGSTRFPSKSVLLLLSQDKENSYRFGEFTSLSVNASLGLRMHRIADAPPSDQRYTKSACYYWITPASPVLAWTFRVLMGLKEGERTTYDPVRMEWLLNAPKSFKIYFLQGILEADGWVNPGNDRIVLVSSPNEKLLMGLLQSLDIPCHLYIQSMITRIA